MRRKFRRHPEAGSKVRTGFGSGRGAEVTVDGGDRRTGRGGWEERKEHADGGPWALGPKHVLLGDGGRLDATV